MKKIIALSLVLMLSFGTAALAAGGKNHGEKGQGSTNTGTKAKGSASQVRAGR